MLFSFTGEAVAFLKNMERPDRPLMQRLMAVIYHLDRASFEILIENILIKQYGQIAHGELEPGYAEYACRWPSAQFHRAYMLFKPDDFDAVVMAASLDPYISDYFVYTQEGYVPKPRELRKLAERGINIIHASMHELAAAAIGLDLIELIRDLANKQKPESGYLIDACLHSRAGQPGIYEAMEFLLRQLEETEFADLAHWLLLRRGFVGSWTGLEFNGFDPEWRRVFVCAQPSPSAADFEKFYHAAIVKQQTHAELCAWFFHQSDADPSYGVREAERDPDSKFGEIDSFKPPLLISFFNDNAWLRRWLIARFDREGLGA